MFARNNSRIVFASIGAALGMTLASAPTHAADETTPDEAAKEHAKHMSRGESHEDARKATEPKVDADKVNARARKHEAQMKEGKAHEAARDAAGPAADADKATARAKKHEAQMRIGKGHEAARQNSSTGEDKPADK